MAGRVAERRKDPNFSTPHRELNCVDGLMRTLERELVRWGGTILQHRVGKTSGPVGAGNCKITHNVIQLIDCK